MSDGLCHAGKITGMVCACKGDWPDEFRGATDGKAFAALKIFKGRAVALEALAEFLLKQDR